MRSRIVLSSVLGVLLLGIVSTCRRSPTTSTRTTSEPATEADQSAATIAVKNNQATTAETAASTAGQLAVITAADPDAEVNVRSQPSQAGEPIGYGQVGDTVVLSRSEAADDGYTWHYVTFPNTTLAGWIRSDLLNIQPSSPSAATPLSTTLNHAPSDVLKQALDEQCGSTQAIETRFITQSYTIYICKLRNRRLYLSQELDTEQVITANEVEALGEGYIISNGDFEYRLDATNGLVIVRFDDSGQQDEVLRETVVYTERY